MKQGAKITRLLISAFKWNKCDLLCMYSYDLDVLQTFSMIVPYMPLGCDDGNPYLTCKHSSRDAYWYKKGVNAGESIMQPWMKQMA